MPLDDVYIHFQYARQIAAGQPYVYNPGLAASSGATSFLYPWLLAVGYGLGFQGLNLGLWAMGLGAVVLAGSLWLMYRLAERLGASAWLAVSTALIFGLSGPVTWHFMSGMETGFTIFFVLGLLAEVMCCSAVDGGGQRRPFWLLIGWASGMALIRPEGGLLVVLTVVMVGWQERRRGIRWGWSIPILAIGAQPTVNWVLTGSAVASGNAAKSVFGMVPFEWGSVIGRVLENWGRMWWEFLTGSSPREGLYIPPLLLGLAVIGLILWVRSGRHEQWRVGLVILGWLVGGMLMIATLDTAFWHFKRYQMPFLVLLFPFAAFSLQRLAISERRVIRRLAYIVVGVMGVVSVWTAGQFWRYYVLNVGYVTAQPLAMARWLEANTPTDAVVAVHDTGMMRYIGGRTTVDLVGLTTPGAAAYWRQGPGAVAEYLLATRPDYVASYGRGHGFGLGMIADTAIYGEPLASFPVVLDNSANVALAADFQGIYKPDWKGLDAYGVIYQHQASSSWNSERLAKFAVQVGEVNVADLKSEQQADYHWYRTSPLTGFPTEVHEFDSLDCYGKVECRLVDGGRRINGEEVFQVSTAASWEAFGEDVILTTRLHPETSGTLDVYVSSEGLPETFIATRWVPAIPGHWLEISTLIPAEYVIPGKSLRFRLVPHFPGGFYQPYFHWVMQGGYIEPTSSDLKPLYELDNVRFQDGAIVLARAGIDYDPVSATMAVNFEWFTDGSATGDYKVFVHVYRDMDAPPIAQADQYAGNGTLPPGNWLPGVLGDRITVDLKGVPPGRYRVAIGLYNPSSGERLQASGGDEQGRYFIGEVEVR